MKILWRGHENSRKIFMVNLFFFIFTGYSWVMICCNPLKTSELWHHEIFGHEIHGFHTHFHGYFMASRSLYSIFHGSWIWKFSQVFYGIFQVFFSWHWDLENVIDLTMKILWQICEFTMNCILYTRLKG